MRKDLNKKYDVLLDETIWKITEYRYDNKFLILESVPFYTGDVKVEKTVEAMSILDKLNSNNPNYEAITEKISSMYNVCSLDKTLKTVPVVTIPINLDDMTSFDEEEHIKKLEESENVVGYNNCGTLIYDIEMPMYEIGHIQRHDNYYTYNKVDEVIVISKEKKEEIDFVKPQFMLRYLKAKNEK